MPKIAPGTYTLQVAMDTRSDFGAWIAKRQVTLTEQPKKRSEEAGRAEERARYLRVKGLLENAIEKGDPEEITEQRADLLWKFFKKTVPLPGKAMFLNAPWQCATENYPGEHKLSAIVRWYPEKSHLRVTADVVDQSFSTAQPGSSDWRHSCLELFVSASGMETDMLHLFVVPDGPGAAPRIKASTWNALSVSTDGTAGSWKRTARGYAVEVKVSWDMIPAYKKDWTILPVEAAIDTNTEAGHVQLRMAGSPSPSSSVFGYGGLRKQ